MAEETVEVEPTIPGTVEETEVPVVTEEPTEEPKEEPKEETPAEEPIEEPVAEEPPVVEEPERPPSRRENLRIQKLIEQLKQKDTPAPTRSEVPKQFDFKTDLDADPEVIARIEAEVDRRAKAAVEANSSFAQRQADSTLFHTRLEIDAPKVETKYPILDPSNQGKFDPAVANAINQWYLATAGYDAKTNTATNANVRYSEFVEGIMELADALAGEKTTKATATIARQAAQTGIRPSGTAAKLNLNKDAADMSDEELEAKLATVFGK